MNLNQSNRVSEHELKSKTKEYWKILEGLDSPDKLPETLKWYVTNLLPLEMTWIQHASPPPKQSCQTLVLLVGYSLEPLLQSIWFHQPARVVLVLSENYGRETGDVMGKHIKNLVTQLRQTKSLADDPVHLLNTDPAIGPKDDKGYFREVKSDPVHVFQLLLDELRIETPEHVVVDITGAKKSMVAGAFFYAAFAGVAITYVEFDDTNFNLKFGRPEGYRSVIRRLSNPYAAFGLREWVRVRHLYSHYDFRLAGETILQDILPIIKQPAPGSSESFFRTEQIEAVKRLIKVLEFYERWDRGDFRHAAAMTTCLPREERPLAVQKLENLLPENLNRNDGEQVAAQLVGHLNQQLHLDKDNRSFLLRPYQLGIYAADEVTRIRRLIEFHDDYRSALMRATGLYELLLQARILTLWFLGRLEYLDNNSSWQPLASSMPDWRKQYEPLLDEMRGLDQYEEFAFKRQLYRINNTSLHVRWPDKPEWEIPDTARLSSSLKELRHKTTHRAVPVFETTARLALETVRASLEDYCQRWATHLEPNFKIPDLDDLAYQAQPWNKICQWCGLDKVLTPNLLHDEEGGQHAAIPVSG